MENFPLVYIILLNFNCSDQTVECIDSLEKIKYPNYKLVIVDNHSEDDSLSILRNLYDKYVIIESCENLGYGNGNNLGICYALQQGAQYVCILNNDVAVESDFLDPLIEYAQKNPKVGIMGPCICEYSNRAVIQALGANINLYTGLAQAKFKKKLYQSIKERELNVDYVGGACFVAKAEVFKEIGLIPENYFLFFEETEFCLKAKQNGFSLVCLCRSRVYHKGSATISKFRGLKYFFLNRNRIIFMRRNANFFQKIIFYIYLLIETVGRILIRKEPFALFEYYKEGIMADANSIDLESVHKYIKS